MEVSAEQAFDNVAKSSEKAARKVDASMDRISADVNRKLEATIDVDVNSAGVDRKLAQLESSLGDVDVEFDTSGIEAKLEAVQAKAAETVEAKVDVDVAQVDAAIAKVETEVAALKREIGQRVTLDVDADTGAAEARIRALNASLRQLRDFKASIDIDVDTDPVERKLDEVAAKVSGIGSGGGGRGVNGGIDSFGKLSFSLAKVAASATAALGAIVPIGPTLVGVAAAAVAVTGAIGLASGALITAGAAASSAALGFATVKVASIGLADAFKAQSKAQEELARTGKVSEGTQQALDAAMEKLAPSAQRLVLKVQELGDTWSKVRKQTQQSLFEGSAAALQRLSDVFLPSVRAALDGVATDLNGFARGFVTAATSARGVEIVNQILTTMRTSLQSIVPAIGNIVSGFATLFTGAAGPSERLSATFLSLTERFNAFATRVTESGDFTAFLERAGEAAGSLLSVLGGLGNVLGKVFGAGAETGVGLLDALGERLNSLGETLGSVEGQSALAGFFDTIAVAGQAFSDVMSAIRPILGGVGKILKSLSPVIDDLRATLLPLAQAIGKTLGGVLTQLAPLLAKVGAAFVKAIQPIVKVIESDLLPAFASIIDALAPVVAEILSTLLPVLGRIIAAIVPVVAAVAEALAPAIAELAEAVAPLVVTLIDALLPVLEQIAPVIVVVAKVVAALATVVAKVVKAITPFLQILIRIAVWLTPTGKIALGLAVIKGAFDKLGPVVKKVGGFFKDLGTAVGNLVKGGLLKLQGVLKTIGKAFLIMSATAIGAFADLLDGASSAFGFLLKGAEKALGWLPGIGGKVKDAKAAFNDLSNSTVEKLRGVEEGLKRTAAGVDNLGKKSAKPKIELEGEKKTFGAFDRIAAALGVLNRKGAKPRIDADTSRIDTKLEALRKKFAALAGNFGSIIVGGADGNPFTPQAMGGIHSRPTFALIGEAGREVVIPLERGSERIAQLLRESGALNRLSERDFLGLVSPRLAASAAPGKVPAQSVARTPGAAKTMGRLDQVAARQRAAREASAGSTVSNVSNNTSVVRASANTRNTVVNATFNLAPNGDPEQHARQTSTRLAALMER